MAEPAHPANPPCPRCGCGATVGNGQRHGRPRSVCGGCARSVGPTTGTALERLTTPAAAVAHTVLAVRRRGSLRAAADVTGHADETVGHGLRQAGAQAETLTEAVAHDLPLGAGEGDACWSFVQYNGGRPSDGRTAGVGERVDCLRSARTRRLVVAWAARPRARAETVVQTTRRRTADGTGGGAMAQRRLSGVCRDDQRHGSGSRAA